MVGDHIVMQDARATAIIGAMIGVPARANMLAALVGGQALTATELALHAGVTQQTASSHLKKMIDTGLLKVEKQGRHRYFRLANARVAEALETLAHLVPATPVVHKKPSKLLSELRASRMCYDHMAGVLGVTVADALTDKGYIIADDTDFTATPAGEAFFADLGLDLAALRTTRRHFARRCLDWSERRSHVGGALGAGLADAFLKNGWIARQSGTRKVTVTEAGENALMDRFGLG